MIIARRGFLTGLSSLLAAPAIVRAESLMPVKVIAPPSLAVSRPHWFLILGVDSFGFPVRDAIDITTQVERGDACIQVSPRKAFAYITGVARPDGFDLVKEDGPPLQVVDYAGLSHKVADPQYYVIPRKGPA